MKFIVSVQVCNLDDPTDISSVVKEIEAPCLPPVGCALFFEHEEHAWDFEVGKVQWEEGVGFTLFCWLHCQDEGHESTAELTSKLIEDGWEFA